MSQKILGRISIGLPPLAEQQRIVARVDELMALCDELEEGQTKAAELRAATTRSTLARIIDSDPAETDDAVALINDHLRLALNPGTGAAEVVTELRKAILDLAVRGRLVPQDPADEPASVLLERIATERERLVAEKKIKKSKEAAGVDRDNGSYPVPHGWTDVRVSDVGVVLRGVTYPKADAQKINADGLIPLLRATNIGPRLDLEDLLFVPEGRVSSSQLLDQGDIVMCMSSGSASLVGKSARVTPTAAGYTFGAFCSAIKPILVGDYLALALRTPQVLRQLIDAGRGIGINNLRIDDLRSALIPLPPLAEQQRIVARVDELMALCDELEEGLLAERRVAAEFADSAVSALVAQDA